MQQKKSNVIRIDELANAMQSTTLYQIRKEKVRFSISKYHDCPIFTLELQNYTFYTTQLSKLDTLPLGVPCGKDCTLSIKLAFALLCSTPFHAHKPAPREADAATLWDYKTSNYCVHRGERLESLCCVP